MRTKMKAARKLYKGFLGALISMGIVGLTGCDGSANPNQSTDSQEKSSSTEVQIASKEEQKGELSGEQLFAVCQACHSITEGEPHKVGPNLYGFMGQPAASREGYTYSTVLSESGIIWNKGLLLGWILSAETMVPSTWMVYHNHLSVENTEKLVDYLISKSE